MDEVVERLPGGRRPLPPRRPRRRRDPDRVGVPARLVRVAADEPPRRRVRRHARKPAAVPAPRAAGGARGASGATGWSACGWSGTSSSTAGSTVRDAPELARGLAASGLIDYLNVIAGTNMRRMSRVDHWPAAPAGTGIWRHLARAVRDAVDIPVCTVGRVNHPDIALDILASGDADLVGMARAHIVDAEFLHEDARRPGRRHPALQRGQRLHQRAAARRADPLPREPGDRPRGHHRRVRRRRGPHGGRGRRRPRRHRGGAAAGGARLRGAAATSAATRSAARCGSGRRRRRAPRCTG